jgi:hypothetical protein
LAGEEGNGGKVSKTKNHPPRNIVYKMGVESHMLSSRVFVHILERLSKDARRNAFPIVDNARVQSPQSKIG